MQSYSSTPSDKDPELWEIAQRRASFKAHLMTFIIIIPFLWIIWFFSDSRDANTGWPWPVWPTFGWGIGLFFHFLGAYVFHKDNMANREYEKLKRDKYQQ